MLDKCRQMETKKNTRNAKMTSVFKKCMAVRQRCAPVCLVPKSRYVSFITHFTIQGPHDSTKETWCKLVCGCVTQDTSKNVTVLWFSPEHWRSLMYIWFILMLLIDVVVTTVFADMTNVASTMLTRMYGCVSPHPCVRMTYCALTILSSTPVVIHTHSLTLTHTQVQQRVSVSRFGACHVLHTLHLLVLGPRGHSMGASH